MLRFTLVTGAWLPWVERTLLTPFAKLQQGVVADQLTGGGAVGPRLRRRELQGRGPLARTIFAFLATWGAGMRRAAVGFTLITAFNVVRLGHLSLIAENRVLLDLLARLRLARRPEGRRRRTVGACWRARGSDQYDQRRVMTSDRQASAVAPGVAGIGATASLT